MWNGVGKLRAALGGCFLFSPQSHRSNTESLVLEDVSFSPLERGQGVCDNRGDLLMKTQ